jgi:hypothetical protein
VRAAPAVSRAKVANKKCTRAYRFSGSSPAFPAQWCYSLYRALPGETWLVVTVIPKKRELLKNLTPTIGASGPHDFAVRITRCSSKAHPRPSLPASNVRDDRETPLLVGTGYVRCEGDLPSRSTLIRCDTLARRANQQMGVKTYLWMRRIFPRRRKEVARGLVLRHPEVPAGFGGPRRMVFSSLRAAILRGSQELAPQDDGEAAARG